MSKKRHKATEPATSDQEKSILVRWLRRRVREAARESILCALAALVTSGVILTLMSLAFLALVGGSLLNEQNALESWRSAAILSLIFITLLFLSSRSAPAYHPGDSRYDSIQALFLAGPRLTQAALAEFRKFRRLGRVDIAACAGVLMILVQRGQKVPLTTLARELGAQPSQAAFSQLLDLDGIVKLHADPVGLSLTEDLRRELLHLGASHAYSGFHRTKTAFQPEVAPPSPEPSPEHKLFGLPASATIEDIKAAYRLRMKQYHPDRYTERGEQWRTWAEEKTKALNAAYEVLLAGHSESQFEATRA